MHCPNITKNGCVSQLGKPTRFPPSRCGSSMFTGRASHCRILILAYWRSFASRLLNNQPPLINEDGEQKRDFVSVHDVASACRLALEVPELGGHTINIGSGQPVSVMEVANLLAEMLERKHIGSTLLPATAKVISAIVSQTSGSRDGCWDMNLR
jgi:nucleoside-diphosphate-sugar epimerase